MGICTSVRDVWQVTRRHYVSRFYSMSPNFNILNVIINMLLAKYVMKTFWIDQYEEKPGQGEHEIKKLKNWITWTACEPYTAQTLNWNTWKHKIIRVWQDKLASKCWGYWLCKALLREKQWGEKEEGKNQIDDATTEDVFLSHFDYHPAPGRKMMSGENDDFSRIVGLINSIWTFTQLHTVGMTYQNGSSVYIPQLQCCIWYCFAVYTAASGGTCWQEKQQQGMADRDWWVSSQEAIQYMLKYTGVTQYHRTLCKKATIHQVTTMLATSKMALGRLLKCRVISTEWLVGGYDMKIGHF